MPLQAAEEAKLHEQPWISESLIITVLSASFSVQTGLKSLDISKQATQKIPPYVYRNQKEFLFFMECRNLSADN